MYMPFSIYFGTELIEPSTSSSLSSSCLQSKRKSCHLLKIFLAMICLFASSFFLLHTVAKPTSVNQILYSSPITDIDPNQSQYQCLHHAYASSHHLFSSLTCASSSGEKSFVILNVLLISSGVFPLIILATVAHVKSKSGLISI